MYSSYYYSSAHSFLEFSLKDNERYDTAFYDLLTLSTFSTKSLQIFSEGATLTRLEKTKKVAEFEPSYKYLNVCTKTADNCNECEKCTRTLLALDAIGKLEPYKSVFNIEHYRKNKQKYLTDLIYYKLLKNINYVELYPLLKSQIKTISKIKGFLKIPKSFIINKIPTNLKPYLKKIYYKFN